MFKMELNKQPFSYNTPISVQERERLLLQHKIER